MVDLLLIFPPQWSPFQPALALPSLAAWLKRSGFAVRSLDLNLLFYEWLLSDECAHLLIRRTKKRQDFNVVLAKARFRHQEARAAFVNAGGETLLGVEG